MPATLSTKEGTQIQLGRKQEAALIRWLEAKAKLNHAKAELAAAEAAIEPAVRMAYATEMANSGEPLETPVRVIGESSQAVFTVADCGSSTMLSRKKADEIEEAFPLFASTLDRFETLEIDQRVLQRPGVRPVVSAALRSLKLPKEVREALVIRKEVAACSAPLLPEAVRIAGRSPERIAEFLEIASPAIKCGLR